MVVNMMTNGQMGVSNFQRHRILDSNCSTNSFSLSAFSIHWRPVFGVDLNGKKITLSRGTINKVMSKGGSDGGLNSGGILEKEFEFKPSFDEYLKVMESVRTVKDRKQDNSSRKLKSKENVKDKVVLGVPLSEGKAENVKMGELEGSFNQKKALKFTKQDKLDGSTDDLMRKQGKMKVISESKDTFYSKESKFDTKLNWKPDRGTADRRWLRYQPGGEEAELEDSSFDQIQNAEMSASSRDRFQNAKGEYGHSTSSLQMLGKNETNDSQRKYGSVAKAYERQKIGVGSDKMHGDLKRNWVQDEKVTVKIASKNRKLTRSNVAFLKRVDDKSLKMEKTAFRNFDEHDDIMDQPRVSRTEMDERIQQLAKWLNGADIDMPEWMFSKMMRSAKIRFTDHSILRVIQILGKLGNWRRVLQVIEWLQMRERFKSHKLRFIYTTALDVLGKARRPVEALNVFRAMQQQMSSYPDLVAYHSIAITLGQAGHMKELFDVIDTMRLPPKKKLKTGAFEKWDPLMEPDIIVYNAVLNACVQRKQWEGAFWVMQQLKQQGLLPSTTTYGLVMEVMFACGKYNLVHDFFRKVQKSSLPNALTYRVLVNTLWREGKVDEAVLAVQTMERRGIVGSAALYYDFARCLCSAGRCQDALKQIEKICKVANKPLVVTYTGLIQACLDSGNIQDAEYIFSQMKDACSPNLVTCNIMLKAYARREMFQKAKELFRKMLKDEDHISNKGDYEVRVTPDIYTFNTLLDACIAEKTWDDFEYVFKRMLRHGYHFNAKRHLRMLLDASRAGKGELLDVTWIHLTEADRTLPPPLIKERFCMKLEKGDHVAAISCIANHNLGKLQEFSKMAWLKLLKENSKRFSRDTLVQVVHEISLRSSGIDLPNPVFDNLVSSCKEHLRTFVSVADTKPAETFPRLQSD
ncbi:hypothetical protein FNV43_RR06282 [Rhamnella rubrinervis]|uniref:Pentatricopeptide repeat-containing protein n=1 Tax=Rhamnella rubrinervis TaxID=2594499 RepID=A0A8K0MLB7_9ROSA|nr:hypothetical protein FNV43_RR06282 [Rhamnella rubrinervis]